jgi:hypothetical protein
VAPHRIRLVADATSGPPRPPSGRACRSSGKLLGGVINEY